MMASPAFLKPGTSARLLAAVFLTHSCLAADFKAGNGDQATPRQEPGEHHNPADVPAALTNAAPGTPDKTWQNFADLLTALGITHCPERLETAALQAMLHTVDPHAAVLSAAKAEAWHLREAGFWQPDSDEPLPPDAAQRERQHLEPLRLERWNAGIVYIAIHGVFENTGAAFAGALENAAANKPAGLIVDLRETAGRDLKSVDRIASFFNDRGRKLYEISTPDGQTLRTAYADRDSERWPKPALVLTGNRTSQAGELLAAILRQSRGVMLLGERTRGDPRLREPLRWSENLYLLLPTAVISPADHPDYTLIGVVPHVTLRPERPAVGTGIASQDGNGLPVQNHDAFPESVNRDPVLRRAVDILIGLRAIQPPRQNGL